jgi:hypothetical protein
MDKTPPDIHDRAPCALREGIMLQTGLALLAQNGGNEGATDTILWIIAAVLVVVGIVSIVRGALLWGILLIIAGLLVGPGGVSILD